MNKLLHRIQEKKQKLDSFRPFPVVLEKNIDDWLRIELTYNSNAIEGNTLSRIETMLIVEKGITAKGKSLVEHQEAINHAQAFDYIVRLVEEKKDISVKNVVMNIHSIILNKINDPYKGRYRDVSVRIQGSQTVLPNPLKVPDKMDEFFNKIEKIKNLSVPEQACIVHYELVSIHPFIDGNGRTARLLMNYILLKNAYPPALIKKEERGTYIDVLEEYHILGASEKYYTYMYKTVERGLDEYLKLLEKSNINIKQGKKLLKIGELATLSGVSIPTVRHWTKAGLLEVQDYTKGGYQLYNESIIKRIKQIRMLQNEDLSLDKIKLKIFVIDHRFN
jgi:Fic family protein